MKEEGISPWSVVSIVGKFWKSCWCWRDEWEVSLQYSSWVAWVERSSNDNVKNF